jgi:hypothetical protein
MDRVLRLYPDLVKSGGLSARLQGALREIGSELDVTSLHEVRLGGRLLGEGSGEEAVRLVVENLPGDCGPAVAVTADDS